MKFFIFIIVLSLVFTGCDAVYRLLDKEGAEEKELVGEVIPFEPNPTIEEIQGLLKLYGYDPGRVDGVLGLRTRNTIERFQKDHGLEVTRFVDKETWSKLKTFKDNELIVDGQLNVPLIQEILIYAGFNSGKVDGKMGPKTKRAIRAFQKEYGLKVDGKMGYQTLKQLSAFLVLE